MVRVEYVGVKCVGVKYGSCGVCWCEVWFVWSVLVWSVVCVECVGVKCGSCGVCWCEVWFVWSVWCEVWLMWWGLVGSCHRDVVSRVWLMEWTVRGMESSGMLSSQCCWESMKTIRSGCG